MKTFEEAPLQTNERHAITEAVRLLKQQFPVEQVILFGSKARGDSDEYSDIDLLCLTSHRLHWKEEKGLVDLLFDIGMKYDVIFTPLDVPLEQWDGGIFTAFPIYQEILRDGAKIA